MESPSASDSDSATFDVAGDSWDIKDRAGFVTILTGADVETVANVDISSGMKCTIQKDKKGSSKTCTIKWFIPAGSFYKLEDDTTLYYFAWEEDTTTNPSTIKSKDYVATHTGTLAY